MGVLVVVVVVGGKCRYYYINETEHELKQAHNTSRFGVMVVVMVVMVVMVVVVVVGGKCRYHNINETAQNVSKLTPTYPMGLWWYPTLPTL